MHALSLVPIEKYADSSYLIQAFYDRVIVMDQGTVVELDTPLALFDKPDSIFRGMVRFFLPTIIGQSH